jgi:ABC-2 type transport system ATP-binding protein
MVGLPSPQNSASLSVYSAHTMSAAKLVLQGVTREYSNFHLGPIDLDLSSGVTCLVGPNGAGKTTLMRLAAGLERPTSGSVTMSTTGHSSVGYLPQEPAFPPRATCRQFLRYVAWLQKVGRGRREEAVTRALSAVDLLDRQDQRIGTLSGGMRRRLGIAHALVHDPELVLLDEPTVGLDPRQRIALRDTIARVSEDRIVIVSTHLVEDVRGLADRVVVLNGGAIVFDGDIGALEGRSDPTAPGDSDLERSIAMLVGDSP